MLNLDSSTTGKRSDSILPELKAENNGAAAPKDPSPRLTEEQSRDKANFELYTRRFGPKDRKHSSSALQRVAKVEAALSKQIFGQKKAITFICERLYRYLTTGKAETILIPGITGSGKTEIGKLVARTLNCEFKQISLGKYAASDHRASEELQDKLDDVLQGYGKNKVRVVALGELDKLATKDSSGNPLTSSTMSIIADLFDPQEKKDQNNTAFTIISFNLRPDIYGETQGHPDLTTIDDLRLRHQAVLGSPAALDCELSKLFATHCVGRFLANTIVTEPLDREAFTQLIEKAIKDTAHLQKFDSAAGFHVEFTQALIDFFLVEAVIPKIQARGTMDTVGEAISGLLGRVKSFMPRTPTWNLATTKLTVRLDYRKDRGVLEAQVTPSETSRELKGYRVTYQPKVRYAAIPYAPEEKLPRNALEDGYRQLGSLLAHVRYGVPFEFARIDKILPDHLPFVKSYAFNERDLSVKNIYSAILVHLAPRAIERIVFAPQPLDREQSYHFITDANNENIAFATKLMTMLIMVDGADSRIGPAVSGVKILGDHESQITIPEWVSERVSIALKGLEDFLVEDMLAGFGREQILKHGIEIARRKRVTEQDVYELLELPYHGCKAFSHEPERSNVGLDAAVRSEQQLKAETLLVGRDKRSTASSLQSAMERALNSRPIGFQPPLQMPR